MPGYYWVITGLLLGYYWVITGLLPGFTGFYRVLRRFGKASARERVPTEKSFDRVEDGKNPFRHSMSSLREGGPYSFTGFLPGFEKRRPVKRSAKMWRGGGRGGGRVG